MEDKMIELEKKLADVDRLIGEILDSEPATEEGMYGLRIKNMVDKLSWLDLAVYR